MSKVKLWLNLFNSKVFVLSIFMKKHNSEKVKRELGQIENLQNSRMKKILLKRIVLWIFAIFRTIPL